MKKNVTLTIDKDLLAEAKRILSIPPKRSLSYFIEVALAELIRSQDISQYPNYKDN